MAIGEARAVGLQGAADALVNGGIIVPEFQKEITDLVRRSGALMNRLNYVPAVGSPSRWFDQTAIADGQATDPHNIAPTATSPTRIEKGVQIKAYTNRIDYSLFDLETVAQQGVFAELKQKDLKDMVNGILRLSGKHLWTGTDTVAGNMVGNSGTQYVGLLNQITTTLTVASGASIVDKIKTQVATMLSDVNFTVLPTAIYVHPLIIDFIDQEVKNNASNMRVLLPGEQEVSIGVNVRSIMTAAGPLPLIPEPFLTMDAAIPGIAAATLPAHNYPFAIVTESLIEYQYIGSREPRVFQLGTLANLQESYVGIQFGNVLAKMAGNAHVVGVVQR